MNTPHNQVGTGRTIQIMVELIPKPISGDSLNVIYVCLTVLQHLVCLGIIGSCHIGQHL